MSAAQILGCGALWPEGAAPLQRARWMLAHPPQLERMDRLCALTLCVADEALAGAAERALASDGCGAEAAPTSGEQCAVLFGSAHGCHATDEAFYRRYLAAGEDPLSASPRLFVYTLPSSPVGEVSIHYGLRGPGLAEVSGVGAGLLALAEGLRLLRRGRVTRALILAAEVETALLTRLRGPAGDVRDCAAALVLQADAQPGALGQVAQVAQRYVPGEPQRAVAAAVAQLLQGRGMTAPLPILAAPELALSAAGLPGPLVQDPALYPPRSGAVGALHAIHRLQVLAQLSGPRAAIVVAADPDGQAVAALWSAQAELAEGVGGHP